MPNFPGIPGPLLPPGYNLQPGGGQAQFTDVGGIPQGNAGDPLNRFGYGALLQAALSRSQLSGAVDKQLAAWGGVTTPLEDALNRTRNTDFNSLLAGSSLASTSSAVATGLEAARSAGAGGGFSRGLAMRAATTAAGVQSGAVADALVKGTLGKLESENQLSAILSQAYAGRAGALSNIYGSESQLSFNIAQLLAGIAAPGSQVAAAGVNKDATVQSSYIGAIGGAYKAALSGGLGG